MKKLLLKLFVFSIFLGIFGLALLIGADKLFFPWYVEMPEHKVPNLIGSYEEMAVTLLEANKLTPVVQGMKYDSRFDIGQVILQNPAPGKMVKENRRVYYYVSGGEPPVKMPNLVGKTLRDAKISLERSGLLIDTLLYVRSEFPSNIIVEQNPIDGEKVLQGSEVTLSISVGPRIGMVRVPNLFGKTIKDGKRILRSNSLKLGKVNYEFSQNLLPNTIIDQYPSENKLVNIGDSVMVYVTKNSDDN